MKKITRKQFALNRPPKKLDLKSNDWRSVFLWLNIHLNLRKK